MKNFMITLGGRQAQVEQKDEQNYVVRVPGDVKYLRVKQDNEGATHWFDTPGNNETLESIEAGKAIEAYLVGK